MATFLGGNLGLPEGGVIIVGLNGGVVLIDMSEGGLIWLWFVGLSFGFSKSGLE